MALPKANSPVYPLTIPSTGQKITYRPYLVKEEKALLLAEQSEDLNVILETMKEVVSSCVKTASFDIEKLAIFDIEYILMKVRSKSVGEIAEVNVPCAHCGHVHTVEVDFSKVEIEFKQGHDKKIPLFDDVGVVMKYPSINILNRLENENDTEVVFDATLECIDYIYDSEKLYYAKDQTKEELMDFVDNLDSPAFERIQKFFDTMPELSHTVEFKCLACNQDNQRKIEGLQNFL